MSKKIIDPTIFTTVQPHYTAKPIFQDIEDPLPHRSGFLMGETDTVVVPNIPKPPPKPQNKSDEIILAEPLTVKQFNEIVDWAAGYYPGKGERNTYWGAIAGFLKRQGILDEDVAEIVYEAATAANDEEARNRQTSALHACDRIDRGMSMTGLQTLVSEFDVEVDEITAVIGTKKVDPDAMIAKLNKSSTEEDIQSTLKHLVGLSSIATEKMLKQIKDQTDISLTALRNDLKKVQSGNSDAPHDYGDMLATQTLQEHFESGETLIYFSKRFMGYNGQFWEEISGDYISRLILPHAENLMKANEHVGANLADLVRQAYSIIKWRSTQKGDALRMLEEPFPIINARNAEIWQYKDGAIDVLPHNPDSYQFGCIEIDYNPEAKCKLFNKTLLEIFAENDEPEEMQRHFYEFLGYLIQPTRDIAAFGMMIGSSNCGKSKIGETIARLLGSTAIANLKLENFKDKDTLGNIVGKRAVLDDDLSQGVMFPDGVVKMLSEFKRVMAELKYQNKFSFLSHALILMIGNHYPRILKADYAIKRRALIFPFKRTFEEDDDNKDLFPSIWNDKNEMSGILNQCIEGYQRLRKRGHFDQPKECKYAYDEWVSGCSFVSKFINEICKPNHDGTNQTWQEHIGRLYDYADAEDVKVNMNPKEIRKAYEMSNIKFGTTGGVLTVKGIKAPDLLEMPL